MNSSIIKFRIKGRGCWFGASIVNNAEVLFLALSLALREQVLDCVKEISECWFSSTKKVVKDQFWNWGKPQIPVINIKIVPRNKGSNARGLCCTK